MKDINDSTAIATPEQFRAALLAVRDRMTAIQLKMLQAHCRSEGHSACTDQLVEESGSTTAKSSYINFARLIAEKLNYQPGDGAKKMMWLHALAHGRGDVKKTTEGQCELIMRPELVETLQAMKWA